MSTIVLIQGIEATSAFRTGFTGSKPPQRLGGTEVSNPLSSGGESTNRRFLPEGRSSGAVSGLASSASNWSILSTMQASAGPCDARIPGGNLGWCGRLGRGSGYPARYRQNAIAGCDGSAPQYRFDPSPCICRPTLIRWRNRAG